MRILELVIENFMRIEAAEIHPDGSMVVLVGPNGAGKTSILNALWAAMGGKDSTPAEPIREGAERAQINVALGENGEPSLSGGARLHREGQSAVGHESRWQDAQYRSPQKMLSDLVGALTFDPLAFAGMDGKKREGLLRTLVGLDTTDLDEVRADVYKERTELSRDLKALGDTSYEEHWSRPKPIDIEVERRAYEAAEAKHDAYIDLQAEALRAERETQASERHLEEVRVGILNAEARFRDAEAAHENIKAQEVAAKTLANEAEDADAGPIMDRIMKASDHNRAIEVYAAKVAKQIKADRLSEEILEKTRRLIEIDKEKKQRIADTEMPVEGLGIDERGVILDGFPFDQGNFEKRLRASVGIGMKMNPMLKVMRLEFASLLDTKHFEMLNEMAETEGYQFWCERVADADTGVGLYIVDGAIYDRDEPEAGDGEADESGEPEGSEEGEGTDGGGHPESAGAQPSAAPDLPGDDVGGEAEQGEPAAGGAVNEGSQLPTE